MDDLDKEMKMSFIDEARQLLEAAEQQFLDLESAGGRSPEVIESIFRLAHNMKGTSRAVGFGEVAEFTHQLENLLLKLKEGKMLVDDETVSLLLECNDHLKVMVDGLSIDLGASFDSREITAKIVTKLAGGSINNGPVSVVVEERHHDVIHSNDVAPQSQELNLTEPALDPMVAIMAQQESGQPPNHPASAIGGRRASQQPVSAPVDESIRVSLGRVEKLSDFIGELVILQTVLNQHRAEIPSPLIQRTVQQLSKISKEIQDISMSLRMIPLKQTFAKLQRIVRDTSKTLNKEVELQMYGEHTEVDKTVLEQVADPLVHIVRNAIDHGLEMPDEREQLGKPKEGHVMIRAFHKGNNLVIEVTDDGRGLDPKRLVQKAIEKGVLPAGAQITDEEALHLIFHPGFSTKDQVSEISGRGVGLDVVRTNVERLGGQVELDSDLGHGSVFRIFLPLTLAIIDGMVVKVGEERYVVPIANVHETVQPRKEDVNFVTGKGDMLNLRDATLPLLRLSHILRLGNTKNQKEASQSIAIIVNSRKQPFAVLVDDILRQQQIVIKKLGAEIRTQKGLTGSAILGDGKPAMILDLNDLMEGMLVGGKSSSQRSIAA